MRKRKTETRKIAEKKNERQRTHTNLYGLAVGIYVCHIRINVIYIYILSTWLETITTPKVIIILSSTLGHHPQIYALKRDN